jgi:drug/metabolite transporter (DMT)-like permease
MRLTIAAAALFLVLVIRYRSLLKISGKDVLFFLFLGTLGPAANQFTYLFTISKINVAAAILLQYLGPSFLAVYSAVFLREKMHPVTLLALVGATAGCYLVVGAYNLDVLAANRLGIFTGLLSALTFAIYSLLSEYGMRRHRPWTVLFYALLVAALAWNVVLPPLEAFCRSYSLVEWGWIMFIGVLGTLVPFGLFLEGINLIRSTRATITATLEPISAAVFSYIFLGEIMETLQAAGGLLVIASVAALQLKRELDEKAPALIRSRAG